MNRKISAIKIVFIGLCSLLFMSCGMNLNINLPEIKEKQTAEPDAATYFTQGNNSLDAGQYEKAVAEYTKSIQLNPEYAPTYYNRGLAYNKMEQSSDKAIADYTKAIQLDPKYGKAYWARASVFLQLKKCDESWKDIGTAIDLGERVRHGFLDSLKKQCPEKDLGSLGKLPRQEAVKRLKRYWNSDPTEKHFGMSVVQGHKEAVELFLAAGLSPDSKHMGDPILCHAVSSFEYDIALRLIQEEADVNIPDGRKNSPLVLAVSHCSIPQLPKGKTKEDLYQLIRALIKSGADLQAKFISGNTVYEMSGIAKCPEVREILGKAGAK